ncbi:hypothetical protein Tco_1454589, partial [Tanacetum coccineum]
DEMLRLQGLGSNTPSGVPYTDDEIMVIVRRDKQRGHIPDVGKLLKSDDKFSHMLTQLESQPEYGGGSESGGTGMMSREMMRTTVRMRRMPIARRC